MLIAKLIITMVLIAHPPFSLEFFSRPAQPFSLESGCLYVGQFEFTANISLKFKVLAKKQANFARASFTADFVLRRKPGQPLLEVENKLQLKDVPIEHFGTSKV